MSHAIDRAIKVYLAETYDRQTSNGVPKKTNNSVEEACPLRPPILGAVSQRLDPDICSDT